MSKKAINRLKTVLAEKLGKNEATISRSCTNDAQPNLKTLPEFSEILNINISELINENN